MTDSWKKMLWKALLDSYIKIENLVCDRQWIIKLKPLELEYNKIKEVKTRHKITLKLTYKINYRKVEKELRLMCN